MEIVREIQPQLARVTGVRAFANNPGSFGQSPRSKPVEFVIQTAEGYDKLNEYVERFLAEAEKNPGFINLDSDLRHNKPQHVVEVAREPVADRAEERRAGKEGVSKCRSVWSAYHEKQNKKRSENKTQQEQ